MNTVNHGVRKLDAMQLVTGQPVYTEDIAPENCLVVKLLRSPHANAIVREIDPDAFVILLPAHQVLGEGFRGTGEEL